MSYIMDLRKFVGHSPLLQCAGSVIIINEKGQLLLGRRTDNHLWGYSGGSVEIGEEIEACARRELKEEMGLTAEELEFFCVNSGPEADYVYPNGDQVSNVEIVYLCRKYTGVPAPRPEEIEELRFFDPGEIDIEQISPPIRPVVRQCIAYLSAGGDSFSVREMLDMQSTLQERYKNRWETIDAEHGKNKLLWMVGEIGEVIDIVKKNGDQAAAADPALRSHLVEEMADVLMFYTDALLCWGISPRELAESYRQKFHRNMTRWEP